MKVSKKLALGIVASFALAGFAAQQPLKGQDASPKAETPKAKTRAQARGRLPAHYGAVVDESQREKIYAIQKAYQPQIEELQMQLAALREKQTGEIEAVLTAEQKEKVKELAAAAKAKREKAALDKKNAEAAKSSDAGAPAAGAKAAEPKTKKAS